LRRRDRLTLLSLKSFAKQISYPLMKALVSRQYETWKKLGVEANLSIN
jgi:hypothetical protein